jgi:hypothetical protein
MACALCGCYDSEHTPRFLDPARPCRVSVCLIPPTQVLPEGRWETCGCPGFEEDEVEEVAG